MTALVLASASPIRARLLRAAGLKIAVAPAAVDEAAVRESLLKDRTPPGGIADALAELKARKVSQSRTDKLVIGADQVLALSGEIIGKSADLTAARELLRRLSGREHELVCAVVLAREGVVVWRHCATVKMVMRPLSGEFLDSYVRREGETALDCVGGYRFEGEGVQLFSHYVGDYFAILGLPLLPLLGALRELGALAE
ncbi:MAG TPA: Maf family nucleotide pyrophosphatase [Rhizomicrobium sp.]|nr:Maf family nucleotide pyrophosphatase [Rhizomicrobium sp.]